MIAFTSQMAHIVSNAFIKSPTAREHKGYSAGSYKDLTRVAWLNPDMWAELLLENRDVLIKELDFFIALFPDTATRSRKTIKSRCVLCWRRAGRSKRSLTEDEKITVNASKPYDILIGSGLLDEAGCMIARVIKGRFAAIVTDDNVEKLYSGRLARHLSPRDSMSSGM